MRFRNSSATEWSKHLWEAGINPGSADSQGKTKVPLSPVTLLFHRFGQCVFRRVFWHLDDHLNPISRSINFQIIEHDHRGGIAALFESRYQQRGLREIDNIDGVGFVVGETSHDQLRGLID